MSGALLAEAIQAAIAIGWALAGWLVAFAIAGTALLLGTLAGLVWVCWTMWRALRRGVAAPLADEQAPQVPEPLSTLHEPPTGLWSLTDKEAA